MLKKKILLLEGIHSGAKSRLENLGFSVELDSASLSKDALIKRAQGFHGVGIRSKTQLTREIIENLPDLEVVGCFCIGTDQVDLGFARSRGIPVFNAPYSNTRSVAELVICEMIALSRRLADRSRQMHSGNWQKSAQGANEVRGKTLGIVGYGHIGSQLSVLAESMGIRVVFYDIIKKLPLGNAHSCDSLQECLGQADFVSLHVPDTALTQNMMTERELAMMKTGSYLINASRGKVVDISALAQVLKSKKLAGAAIDVFPKEPESNKEVFVSDLQELENVILTPHIGGSTEEAQEAIGQEVAESFNSYFHAGATSGSVNFPILNVAFPTETPRILNIHKNVPGVLGAINGIFSELKGNVRAQYLGTASDIGYLIMDIEIVNVDEGIQRIQGLPTSIRTRKL